MKINLLKHTKVLLAALTLFTFVAMPFTASAAELENNYIDEVNYEGILTIESPETVNNIDEFNVYGTASYKGGSVPADSHLFLEIVNKDSEKPYIYEVQLVESVVNGEYLFSSIRIPSGYADDLYLIRVYLIDDDSSEIVGFSEKEVTLINQ